jgi:predicted nucleotidyltransferase component of viral defense system
MISDKEIEAKADEFKLRPLEVQKDYVYGRLLRDLFERPALARGLVLNGGNVLRKGYCPDLAYRRI